MENNFSKIIVLYKGKCYQIDKKPEFHQEACKHKFIKAQIVKSLGEDISKKFAAINLTSRLPKKVSICKNCGKVKKNN